MRPQIRTQSPCSSCEARISRNWAWRCPRAKLLQAVIPYSYGNLLGIAADFSVIGVLIDCADGMGLEITNVSHILLVH